jgi:hypothetical protein
MSELALLGFYTLNDGNGPVSDATLRLLMGRERNGLREFSQVQVDRVTGVCNWSVHRATTETQFASGLQAALFRRADGDMVLSIRGFQPTGDLRDWLSAGFPLVGSQGADLQLLDLFRYYKMLSASAGQPVIYTDQELAALGPLNAVVVDGRFVRASTVEEMRAFVAGDLGVGGLDGGQTFTVTGYSLGGHLAPRLAGLIGPARVTQSYSFNAPGFGTINFPADRINDYLEFTGYDWLSRVGLPRERPGRRVFIEDIGPGPLDAFTNHLVLRITDSLLVTEVLRLIDPVFENLERASRLLDAASPAAERPQTRTAIN